MTILRIIDDLDYKFHLLIAIASSNLVYPLIINSFKEVYTGLTGKFFHQYHGTPVIQAVHDFHQQLVAAIGIQETDSAVQIMIEMLKHGERYLKGERP